SAASDSSSTPLSGRERSARPVRAPKERSRSDSQRIGMCKAKQNRSRARDVPTAPIFLASRATALWFDRRLVTTAASGGRRPRVKQRMGGEHDRTAFSGAGQNALVGC